MDSAKIAQIIKLSHSFDVKDSENDLYKLLAQEGLLPKKMVPKDVVVMGSKFASPKAEEFANVNSIKIGEAEVGTGKNGSLTIADLKKIQKSAIVKPDVDASPQALILAKENNIEISEITGTGKNGKIKIDDVKSIIDKDKPKKPKISITPQAQLLANENSITLKQLQNIKGSGADGKILKGDIEEFLSSSESGEDSE